MYLINIFKKIPIKIILTVNYFFSPITQMHNKMVDEK